MDTASIASLTKFMAKNKHIHIILTIFVPCLTHPAVQHRMTDSRAGKNHRYSLKAKTILEKFSQLFVLENCIA